MTLPAGVSVRRDSPGVYSVRVTSQPANPGPVLLGVLFQPRPRFIGKVIRDRVTRRWSIVDGRDRAYAQRDDAVRALLDQAGAR